MRENINYLIIGVIISIAFLFIGWIFFFSCEYPQQTVEFGYCNPISLNCIYTDHFDLDDVRICNFNGIYILRNLSENDRPACSLAPQYYNEKKDEHYTDKKYFFSKYADKNFTTLKRDYKIEEDIYTTKMRFKVYNLSDGKKCGLKPVWD